MGQWPLGPLILCFFLGALVIPGVRGALTPAGHGPSIRYLVGFDADQPVQRDAGVSPVQVEVLALRRFSQAETVRCATHYVTHTHTHTHGHIHTHIQTLLSVFAKQYLSKASTYGQFHKTKHFILFNVHHLVNQT